MSWMNRVENVLLSLWIGAMVGIGYIAAPVLFKLLDDRSMAGRLAGQMFEIVAVAGLVIGLILVVTVAMSQKLDSLREWRFWVLGLMLVIVISSLFIVQPMMADLKAQGLTPGSDAARQFGMMHGVSSMLYLATTLGGVMLLLMGLRSGKIRLKADDIKSL